ncbi:MAG: hypothetical protein AAGA81_11875, partial [Acidobacteriota bacterium]
MPASLSSTFPTSRGLQLTAGSALLPILLTTLACSGLPVVEPRMSPGAFTPVVIAGPSPVAEGASERAKPVA